MFIEGVMRKCFVAILAPAVLAGCAIHPQTEDFSRSALPDIVHQVRCEAKRAIEAVFSEYSDPLRDSGVTFDFMFTLTEDNSATTRGSVKVPIHLGSLTVGWDAGIVKEREAIQLIVVTDSFKKLTEMGDCAEAARRNFKYPITGNIGLLETFENYRRLVNENSGLFTEFSDQVKFSTTISGSVNPVVNLSPVDRTISAEAKVGAGREDIHRVKLAFSTPKADPRIAREKELAKLAEERRRAPTYVVVVDANGVPINPKASPLSRERSVPGGGNSPNRKRGAEDKALPKNNQNGVSSDEIERRTYEQYLRNESRRFNDQILEELRDNR